jgi:hypothetical protein
VAGDIPPKLKSKLAPHFGPGMPEFVRLPRPKEREELTGATRSWLLDFDRSLPTSRRFIVRVRLRGKQRGVCFLDVAKYLAALHAESNGGEQE